MTMDLPYKQDLRKLSDDEKFKIMDSNLDKWTDIDTDLTIYYEKLVKDITELGGGSATTSPHDKKEAELIDRIDELMSKFCNAYDSLMEYELNKYSKKK